MRIVAATPYLRVSDMQRSLAFYRDGLGFEVVNDSSGDDGVFWASLRKDNLTLMICLDPIRTFEHDGLESTPHEHDEHGRHVFPGSQAVIGADLNQVTFLYVDDVDAVYEELNRRGVQLTEEPQDRFYGVREFLISDPDGYYYSIAQPLR